MAMRVIVKYTAGGISIYAANGMGIAKVGDQSLSGGSMSRQKADLIRRLYDDGGEYDMERFFRSWIALKMLRMTRITSDKVMENQLKEIRAVLLPDEVKVLKDGE